MRDTMNTLALEILNHLVNLKTDHESEARLTLPGGITLARSINWGDVDRVSATGKARLIMTRDMLAQWRSRQYDMSPSEASRAALAGTWQAE